jgi:hypothetical protein
LEHICRRKKGYKTPTCNIFDAFRDEKTTKSEHTLPIFYKKKMPIDIANRTDIGVYFVYL